jgi:putative peptidoglycan lipid II flippase
MTRIILPAQLFFFVGSVMGSHLQVRKIFIYQACAPLIYNAGIILGALIARYATVQHGAGQQFAIHSLSLGVLVGMFVGYGLLNTIAALRTGLRYRPVIGFRDPAFLEWLRLSLPLMIGVSLVMFDGIFLNYFGSLREGGITLLGNAKDLFNAPFNIIGPAAGAASLPFFASLYQQKRTHDFSHAVARALSRLFSTGMLVSAWMIALAPWLMDLFRGGHFRHADAAGTTQLFVILAGTLSIWAVQGIYARAFYAASDTTTPAVTGTIITVLSVPIYAALFRSFDLKGLALASDFGILIQTATLAILLDRRELVSFADLEWSEFARALLAAVIAWAGAWTAAHALRLPQSHLADVITIAAGSIVWAVLAAAVLQLTGSQLLRQLRARF